MYKNIHLLIAFVATFMESHVFPAHTICKKNAIIIDNNNESKYFLLSEVF